MIERSILSAAYTRRDFMKAVSTATAIMGLPLTMAEDVMAAAGKEDKRPPVIWLHFQECTGCSEALLRASHPNIAEVVLDIINLEYQETLMAGSGDQAEHALHEAIKKHEGKYILVVEGSIPVPVKTHIDPENPTTVSNSDPKYDLDTCCQIGGKTAYDSFTEAASKAGVIIALGACACNGGIVAIEPNPTNARGVEQILKDKEFLNKTGIDPDKQFISLPGCPPNPYNILSVILYIVTFGKLPEKDSQYRPLFAYGRLIHEHCERRPHFDAGRFVQKFGDEGHRNGWCLYKMGCKGPETYANCSIIHFNDGAAWPIGNGSPCIGCTEGHVLFKDSLFSLAKVYQPKPNSNAPTSEPTNRGKEATITQAAVVGGLVGAAVGAGAMFAGKLPKEQEDENK